MTEKQVGIVTGGGGVIGRAVALKMAADGASVVVGDVDLQQAQHTVREIEASGTSALAVEVDVRDREGIKRMVDIALDRYRHIDILINNAGGSARQKNAPFHQQEAEVIEWVLEVNLMGAIFCTREVIGHMIEHGRGKVVNISSILGVQGMAQHVDYSAAKGGLIAMTKALAKEVGIKGINVNCVSPGRIPRHKVDEDYAVRYSYLGRVGTPEDVANLVSFLTSEDAAFITGQNYIIDGGRSLGLRGS